MDIVIVTVIGLMVAAGGFAMGDAGGISRVNLLLSDSELVVSSIIEIEVNFVTDSARGLRSFAKVSCVDVVAGVSGPVLFTRLLVVGVIWLRVVCVVVDVVSVELVVLVVPGDAALAVDVIGVTAVFEDVLMEVVEPLVGDALGAR